jgi:predicted nucleotidyltransferase
MNRSLIILTLSQHQALLQAHGIERIGLFGSFVRDEQTDSSDIDLLVHFSKGEKSLHNLVSLGEELEKLFGRSVELVTNESLSKYIGPHILNEVQYASFYN